MEPITCCGYQLRGPNGQGWTYLGLPGKMWEILVQRAPWIPLRGLGHDVALSPEKEESLGAQTPLTYTQGLAEVLGLPLALYPR